MAGHGSAIGSEFDFRLSKIQTEKLDPITNTVYITLCHVRIVKDWQTESGGDCL